MDTFSRTISEKKKCSVEQTLGFTLRSSAYNLLVPTNTNWLIDGDDGNITGELNIYMLRRNQNFLFLCYFYFLGLRAPYILVLLHG